MTVTTAPHTPGVWTVEDPFDWELTIVEAGKETHEWRFIASCSHEQGIPKREVKANARLIAAAPDMLAMLKEIRLWLDEDMGAWDAKFIEEVDALVAKAEGR